MVIDANEFITQGELQVTGRLVDASNATLFGECRIGETALNVIYKPIAGERPLWDFPDGTLAGREVAAYRLSEIFGMKIVPLTILRDGPFGPGAVQQWVDVDETVDIIDLAQSHDVRLRKFVLFDAIINNTDRKMGHLLPLSDGRLLGCDHGVCFHEEDKLRTVLWQWMGKELAPDEIQLLQLATERFEVFVDDVRDFLAPAEIEATHYRIERLLSEQVFPSPSEDWPAVPWPPI